MQNVIGIVADNAEVLNTRLCACATIVRHSLVCNRHETRDFLL